MKTRSTKGQADASYTWPSASIIAKIVWVVATFPALQVADLGLHKFLAD
jgi:hypothetical protein